MAAIDNMKETETELADLKAHSLLLTEKLKGPSQPPPISMTLKLLIQHDEANSYYFTASCDPEGVFNYLG